MDSVQTWGQTQTKKRCTTYVINHLFFMPASTRKKLCCHEALSAFSPASFRWINVSNVAREIRGLVYLIYAQ